MKWLFLFIAIVAEVIGTSAFLRDNWSYDYTQYGTKYWMTHNLHYLPEVHSSSSDSYVSARYYVYNYEGSSAEARAQFNYSLYGVLYNWEAAKTACPSGWHRPPNQEWVDLEIAAGMTSERANDTGWRGNIVPALTYINTWDFRSGA